MTHEENASAEHEARRHRLALVMVPLIGIIVAANVGDALAPTLVDQHPLLLLVLNARNRNLALVTNYLDAWTYYIVGTLRLLLSDPLFFLIGYWYGDAAIAWIERRSSTYGGFLRKAEGWFGKASYPLVFAAPNNFICMFAGAARMRLSVFLTLNISGTLVRLFLIRQLGQAFERPIDNFLDWIARYRLPLLALTIGLTALSVWNDRRKGVGDLEGLAHLEDDLEPDVADDVEEDV